MRSERRRKEEEETMIECERKEAGGDKGMEG